MTTTDQPIHLRIAAALSTESGYPTTEMSGRLVVEGSRIGWWVYGDGCIRLSHGSVMWWDYRYPNTIQWPSAGMSVSGSRAVLRAIEIAARAAGGAT